MMLLVAFLGCPAAAQTAPPPAPTRAPPPAAALDDHDFAQRVTAQSQATIELAEAELQSGTDPQMRELAGRMIATQTHQIAVVDRWQSKGHKKK
jgi:uncharacterized protein (DUF305 family)